jgi:hypothetical protein
MNDGMSETCLHKLTHYPIPELRTMFDELDRLRTDDNLQALLSHYATLGEPNRETWQDRLMECGNISRESLVRLHGELLAHGWIEQNVGILPLLRAGALPLCYRVTAAGLRALIRARELETDESLPRAS